MQEEAASEVIRFWFDEIDHSHWFIKDAKFDKLLDDRFGELLMQGRNGELDDWCESAQGCLALVVLLDQFSRNIYRDTPIAFESDPKALRLVLDGIEKKFDEQMSLEQRSIYYLPLRHAEDLEAQQLGLRKTREINAEGYGTDKYALSHLALITKFGRFPHRNKILNRENSPEEAEYLEKENAGF